MDIRSMHRQDFEAIPLAGWKDDIGEFDALIIIPAEVSKLAIIAYNVASVIANKIPWVKRPEMWSWVGGMHDSGYRQMSFVAVKGDKPICRLAGGSDVIHFDGIGGYGYDWISKFNGIPDSLPVRDWNIDCLPTSGLLKIFSHKYNLRVAPPLSSFELYAIEKDSK